MSSRLSSRLSLSISSHIVHKNRQLRQFSQLLLNVDFLRFAELVEETADHIEELAGRLSEIPTGELLSNFLKKKIDQLCSAKNRCLKQLEAFQGTCRCCADSDFERIFYERLTRTANHLEFAFRAFTREVEAKIHQLPEIYEIHDYQQHLKHTSLLNLIVLNNHRNFQFIATQESLKHRSTYHTSQLKVHTHLLFQDILARYHTLIEEMESTHSGSIESLREILNAEINKSRTELVIEETELTELRQELFPSEVSLKEQREAAIDQLEIKELDLEHKIRSIDLLQTNIQGLEFQVAQLVKERVRVQEELMMKRESLRSGIREIVRLEKLIAQIERDISDRLVAFQDKLHGLEEQRLAILADESLTEEERARLLAELDQEIAEIREKHEADQQLLKDKCEELKVLSKSVTEDLDLFKDELMKKHMDEIRELEAMMENASPSELEILKAKIAALQQEFEENMEMLERAKGRPHYLEDEFGRYYINEAGQKVYQRDSNASQYIMDENGEWVKIKDAVEILVDEKGEYFIDSFGKKIYTKKYFEDEFGKYYIDSRGKRIYLEPSEPSEKSEEPTEPVPESIPSESEEYIEPASESELRLSEKLRQQRASDIKYVQDSVGFALRKGLALTILYQPKDPIEFLAKFLQKFHRDQKKEAERAQLMARVMQIKQQMREAISEVTRLLETPQATQYH